MKVLGKVLVDVIKATGSEFTGAWNSTGFRISLESDDPDNFFSTALKKKSFGFDFLRQSNTSSTTEIDWNENFELFFGDVHDRIVVKCVRENSKRKFACIGYIKIPIENLFHAEGPTERWYQMIHNHQNSNIMVYVRFSVKTLSKQRFISSTRYEFSDNMDEQGALKFFPTRDSVIDEYPDHSDSYIHPARLVESFYGLEICETTLNAYAFQEGKISWMLPASSASVANIYPITQDLSENLDEVVQSFCFPTGIMVYHIPEGRDDIIPKPKCFSFKLQEKELFGSVLVFYELFLHDSKKIATPKVFSIVSKFSFVTQFESILKFLYFEFVKQEIETIRSVDIFSKLSPIVHWLVDECPFPVAGSKDIVISAAPSLNETVPRLSAIFSLPKSSFDFPPLDCEISLLFDILSMDDVVEIWSAIVSETSVIFVSSQCSILFPVVECLLGLCYPFTWPHTYIPIMPSFMATVLEAPVPFVVGCHSNIFETKKHIIDQATLVVDLDCGIVQKHLKYSIPPSLQLELYSSLKKLTKQKILEMDQVSVLKEVQGSLSATKEQVQKEIRKAFLCCLYNLLNGYRKFLMFSSSNQTVFDVAAFIKTQPSESLPFLSRFLTTSMFKIFVENHVERVNYFRDTYDYIINHSNMDGYEKHEIETIEIPSYTRSPSGSFQWNDHTSKLTLYKNERKRTGASRKTSSADSTPKNGAKLQRFKSLSFITSTNKKSLLKERRVEPKQPFLLEKSWIEFQKLNTSKTNVFQEIIDSMFNSSAEFPFPFADLASAAELLKLGEWRSFFTLKFRLNLEKRKSSLELSLAYFDALLFLSKFMLSECYFDQDFGNCKRMLDLSSRIYRIGIDGEHRYLRDSFKDFKIFCQPDFWAFYMTIEVLTQSYPSGALENPQQYASLTDMDFRDNSTEVSWTSLKFHKLRSRVLSVEKWNEFIYTNLVGLFTVMEGLDITYKMIKMCIVDLADIQELPDDSVEELCVLMSSLHRSRKALQGHFMDNSELDHILPMSPVNSRRPRSRSNEIPSIIASRRTSYHVH